jgi:hypothetical protein
MWQTVARRGIDVKWPSRQRAELWYRGLAAVGPRRPRCGASGCANGEEPVKD